MENLLAVLPLLACPLMMGVMMMWMMRGQSGQRGDATSVDQIQTSQRVTSRDETAMPRGAPAGPPARPIWSAFAMCLNGKAVAALGVIAVAVWVLAPGFFWAALPILVLAACPLSMLLMMRGRHGAS